MLNGSGGEVINFEFNSEKGSSYTMSRPFGERGLLQTRTYIQGYQLRANQVQAILIHDREPCSNCPGDKLNDAVCKVPSAV
ncbi:MAG: hypothetical protein Ct9H90mP1_0730 [Methanobacteriota archaeon]|nr:MAG: hypothetical protein Ct9H90mP1_0730 [Euryarchaeota archaeon]